MALSSITGFSIVMYMYDVFRLLFLELLYAWLITRLNGTCIWHAMGGVHICTRSLVCKRTPSSRCIPQVFYPSKVYVSIAGQIIGCFGSRTKSGYLLFFRLYRTKTSNVGPNSAACFGPRTKLSKACCSLPDQIRLPKTVLGPFQDRTDLAVTVHSVSAG